jgi:uncharacterized protein
MDNIRQHAAGVSCLDHCIFVSYVSFVACKHLGLDSTSAARAGLLHDMVFVRLARNTGQSLQEAGYPPKNGFGNADNFKPSNWKRISY